jgi:hypothetical protein
MTDASAASGAPLRAIPDLERNPAEVRRDDVNFAPGRVRRGPAADHWPSVTPRSSLK